MIPQSSGWSQLLEGREVGKRSLPGAYFFEEIVDDMLIATGAGVPQQQRGEGRPAHAQSVFSAPLSMIVSLGSVAPPACSTVTIT